jgi:Sulfotransferase family
LSDPKYGLLDRILHRLALQYGSVAEMSFDIDQGRVRSDPTRIERGRHVFVTGLARAGTTVLMRRFHTAGLYRSLTYRDMPFVLAPNLWRRLSGGFRRHIASAERAHGDQVMVDADSPESLDEVFWRVFAGDEYLRKDCLVPHAPAADAVRKYVRYVNAVLAADDKPRERYLCKNNNNVLRLGTIRSAFPASLVLVAFRHPLQHAQSLLRQHRHFAKAQAEQPFTLSYMTWLGHHEFGLDHRPFRFSATPGATSFEPDTLDYWLQLWCDTYEWLEKTKPATARFVCYEDLCGNPGTWARLAALADIPPDQPGAVPFVLSERPVTLQVDSTLAGRSEAIYARLVASARAALS